MSDYGPFCSVPGCTDRAEGAVLFAYVKEQKRYLCTDHMRPIRAALLELLHEPEHAIADKG
jgi:hypothetical protein